MKYANETAIREKLSGGLGDTLGSNESEIAVIGALLSAPHRADEICDQLAPDRFSHPVMGRLFEIIAQHAAQGQGCSPALVDHAMGANLAYGRWGGLDALLNLRDTGSTHDLAGHVAAINDRHGRRGLKALCADLAIKAADTSEGDFQGLLAEFEGRAADLARNGEKRSHFIAAADLVREAIDFAQARTGVVEYPFGLTEVDALVNGMEAGRCTWIGGRPGMAKTIAAQAVGKANAMAGKATCLFSLEMSAHPMGIRLACDLAYRRDAVIYSGFSGPIGNPTLDRALKNSLNASQWDALREAEALVAGLPLFYDTRPGLTVPQIEAAARRHHRTCERQGMAPGPVLVDHIGKVRHGAGHKGDLRTGFAAVSRDLSEVAKRLGVPVLGMAQLSRSIEGREDKRPMLTDLREAGQLEEDATQVIFLYRPEYYLRKPKDEENFEAAAEREAELAKVRNQLFWLVEKNNNGPTDQVKTFIDVSCAAIRDWQVTQ